MPANPSQPIPFDSAVTGQLACPACRSALRLDAGQLVCAGCGRAYPIVDGIPALIAGREVNPRVALS
jgi:uncharacterized protein YbaR (Trm112 family)